VGWTATIREKASQEGTREASQEGTREASQEDLMASRAAVTRTDSLPKTFLDYSPVGSWAEYHSALAANAPAWVRSRHGSALEIEAARRRPGR
jgi:hypothetical protein